MDSAPKHDSDPVPSDRDGDPVPAPCAPRAGEHFAGHELIEVIARGGMGVVYRARELRGGRIVALKTVLFVEDESDRRRFEFETRAAARLDHPGVVPLFQVGEVDGTPFYTMKFISGGTLQQRAGRLRREPRRLAAVMIQVADAIGFAHGHGILHRDIKPANILLDGEQPRIVDFGLACPLGEAGTRWTQSGALIGTAGYMAPEQARGGGRLATVATDVYGLGAVLYYLLTGAAPFEAETLAATLQMVIDEDPPDPRIGHPGIDVDLAAICMRALEKVPSERYDTAERMADDLRRWLDGEPVSARPLPRRVVFWRRVRRRPLRALAVFLLAAMPIVTLLVCGLHLGALDEAHGRAIVRRDQILASNQFSARLAAKAVGWRLRQLAEPVIAAADRADVTALLASGDPRACVAWLEGRATERHRDLAEFKASPYEAWLLYQVDGTLLARWPARGTRTAERDYRAAAQAHGLYISPVMRPEGLGEDRYGLCVPIRSEDGVRGILVAEVGGGLLGLPAEHDAVRKTALLARVQGEDSVRIIAHEAYRQGQPAVNADASVFAGVDQAVSRVDYRDPTGGSYAGRWLAAIAPVAGAPFFVVIQERFDDDTKARAAVDRGRSVWQLFGLITALGAAVCALIAWPTKRRPSS